MSLLEVRDMSVQFGGLKALSDIDMRVEAGQLSGLIGPNGAGKTTLFNAITGVVQVTSGEILFNGKSVLRMKPDQIAHLGISRTFQNIRLFRKMTVTENVMIGLHSIPEYAFVRGMIRLPDIRGKDRRAKEEALEYLKLVDMLEYRDHIAGALAYGLQRKLEIARAIATKPKLLLLDEPAAGMNNEETAELIGFIKHLHTVNDSSMAILIIEHHLEVVMNLCSSITVFNLGKVLARGTPEQILNNDEVIKAYIGQRRNVG